MCGIAGFLHFDKSRDADIHLLKKMADSLQHRGPDGEGFYVNRNVGLGHRRLSIIDLDTGDQPIFNEDKTIAIVFNGEIYNYLELRDELKMFGHQFRTSSDTEVIVHAYEQWGTNCLQKFNGCWAFALWDENTKQLFIARDRLGEKPLFYMQWDNTLIFGSEIKSIFAFGVPSKIRTELIQIYLSLSYIPAPLTFFENIQKLEAGHYLIVNGSSINKNKFWDLPSIDEGNMLSDKNKIYDEFEYLLRDSVKLRMRSDVPYGSFLSGGLDSSSIVAIMSETSNHPVETFTVGFDDKEFNERDLARQVAEKFKTSHHEATFNSSVFDKALKEVVKHFDEPFGDFSTIPTSYVCDYARKYVKMVLTGDGGDEALSGYPTYELINFGRYYNRIPNIIRKIIPAGVNKISKFSRGKPRYFLNRTYKVLSAFELDFEERLLQKASWIPESNKKNLFLFNNNHYQTNDFLSEFYKSCSYTDDFYKLMHFHLKISLPDDMLAKVDRISMAHSLEARVPFLDHRLVEFLVKVDKRVKLQGLETKSILRKTLGKKLPSDLLKAGKKGFSIPIREWFKEHTFDNYINNLSRLEEVGLNSKIIKEICEKNKTRQQDSGYFIWMLFVLDKVIFEK